MDRFYPERNKPKPPQLPTVRGSGYCTKTYRTVPRGVNLLNLCPPPLPASTRQRHSHREKGATTQSRSCVHTYACACTHPGVTFCYRNEVLLEPSERRVDPFLPVPVLAAAAARAIVRSLFLSLLE